MPSSNYTPSPEEWEVIEAEEEHRRRVADAILASLRAEVSTKKREEDEVNEVLAGYRKAFLDGTLKASE